MKNGTNIKASRSAGKISGVAVLSAILLSAAVFAGCFIDIPDGEPGPYADRRYQNPAEYVQISDSISTHGYDYYTSPVLVNRASARDDHIEAMIRTAFKYLGDPFVNRESREPGPGVDCSGLVMQACYGAGVDLWPSNPYRHKYGDDRYEWESREIAKLDNLKTVPYEDRRRGDLVFYENSKGKVVHVAIYLGFGRIIHSSNSLSGVVITRADYSDNAHICLVKRVFN